MKPFGFYFGEGWRKMYCGGKAEEICFYSFYCYNIILTTKLFHTEPSRLGCNFGDALCFPWWMFCSFVNSAQLSRVTQMRSVLERNKPRRFPDLWSVLWCCCFLWSVGRARPGDSTILCQSTTCPGQTFTWSAGSFVLENKFSVLKLKELLLSGRTIKKENTDLISSKHFQNPSYTHNPLCPSTTSHSELKLYVFPHSIRCQSILAKVPMSPTTERLGQKKSPPERKPICVLIHSAGLDMSKQPAFTAVATLFTSNCQAAGISTHSLNQGWWQQTKHPHPWIERNKHFSRNT